MSLKFIVYFLSCMTVGTISANNVPVVHSKLGEINGKTITTEFQGKDYTINRYAGLRYAKAPVGELRFQRPVPFGNYDSPLDASEFTSACPQNDMMKLGVDSKDEDCLSLSVYVPTEKSDRPEGFAVMIFIHGGGFSIGASNSYPGDVFAGYGNVILVTINYRLSLLGFADTGDGLIPSNNGLWDQRMALQWVKDNIESFGGDTSRITIFGESAGGISVIMHGLDPSSKGLFHNVIAESGTPTMPLHVARNNLDNLKYVADKFDCRTETTNDVVECLKNVPTADLMAKFANLSLELEGAVKTQFLPTIDGAFIPQPWADFIAESKQGMKNEQLDFFRSLNLINGMNNAEGAMLLLFIGQQDLENITLSMEEFRYTQLPNIVQYFLNQAGKNVPQALLDIIFYEYTDWDNLDNFRQAFVDMIGDLFFTASGREWLDIHANSTASNTYYYSFDADIELNPIPKPSWVKGANHGIELLPLFGYCMSTLVGTAAMENMTDYTPPPWELDLSERMMTYWTNFAKTGNPNGNSSSDLLQWPQTEADGTAYIRFNNKDEVRQDNLYAKSKQFWRDIVPALWESLNKAEEHCHGEGSAFEKKSSETCDKDGNCD